LRRALVRSSSLTGTDFQPEARRAPRVVGRDAGTSGFVIDATVPPALVRTTAQEASRSQMALCVLLSRESASDSGGYQVAQNRRTCFKQPEFGQIESKFISPGRPKNCIVIPAERMYLDFSSRVTWLDDEKVYPF
jgi:hypothetical protein